MYICSKYFLNNCCSLPFISENFKSNYDILQKKGPYSTGYIGVKSVELWHLTCVGNPAASASTEAHFRWKLPDAFVEGIIFFEQKLCINQPGTDLAPFFMRTTSQSLWWSCASRQRRKAINSSIQLECLRTTNIPKPVRYIGRYKVMIIFWHYPTSLTWTLGLHNRSEFLIGAINVAKFLWQVVP